MNIEQEFLRLQGLKTVANERATGVLKKFQVSKADVWAAIKDVSDVNLVISTDVAKLNDHIFRYHLNQHRSRLIAQIVSNYAFELHQLHNALLKRLS